MSVIGPFAVFGVLGTLVAWGDATETFNYIEASQGLLRSGIAGLLVVSMLAILVPWARYVLLAPVHRSLVLLTIWLQVAFGAVGRIRIDSLTDSDQPFTQVSLN